MNHFSTLKDYCAGINISPPKWDDFDIRSFEENMKSVHAKMPPFKHEFYAIAIKTDGGGGTKIGNFDTIDKKITVFFNSPYQIISWNIPPDWKGYYVIFTEDFYRNTMQLRRTTNNKSRITELFPFLLIDNTVPLEINSEEIALFSRVFQDIKLEFDLNENSSKEVIVYYLHILLVKIGRLYLKQNQTAFQGKTQRNQDIELVSRFKSLLETSFRPGLEYDDNAPHQVRFYAEKLNLHPSHFNAVIKRITEKSASEHIYQHVFSLAKSRLVNTSSSVKEIAFDLYYPYANHFASFFKARAKMTPSQYRNSVKK